MSFVKDQCALMGRIQVQNQKDMDAYIEALVRLPAPINPDSSPICMDANSAPLVAGGESDLPMVSQHDEE